MIPFLKQLLSLCIWLTFLAVVFVPLERFFAVHPHKTLRRGLMTDLGYYFLNSLLPAVLLGFLASLLVQTVHLLLPASFLTWSAGLSFWARTALAFVLGEIGYYWGHRLSHQIPCLWRFHSVHHSAEEMDFLVNTRAHPLDMVFCRFCGLLPLALLGLTSPDISSLGNMAAILGLVISTGWGFFIHANLRWSFGPLEWLISSPKFHHWHHTRTGAIDHNYSSTLPWIDRIFGTHNLPKEWPESYGIEAQLPDTLLNQLQYPFWLEESQAQPQSAAEAEPTVQTLKAND